MRRLSVFNSISVDGYFVDGQGDMNWAHRQDAETDAFASENASGGGELVFGRVTYDLMASYWPTAQARAALPVVAERMNSARKVVFSRTLADVSWTNTEVISADPTDSIRERKSSSGPDMVILGSGTIVAQLSAAGLIDEYQFIVNPIVLGNGRTLFDGVARPLELELLSTRAFENGNVAMVYRPADVTRSDDG